MHTLERKPRTTRQFVAFILAGLTVATALSVYLVVWALIRPARFEKAYGASVTVALLVNYASGMVGGALVWLLLPLARTAVGAAVVGSVVGAVLLAMLGFSMNPSTEWWRILPWYVVFGVFAGAYSGLLARSMWGQRR